MRFINKYAFHLVVLIAAAAILSGCATTRSGENINPAVVVQEVQQPTESEGEAVPADPVGIQLSQTQPFANRVEWPAKPESAEATPVYQIESGTAENVWVGGKGYFQGNLEQVYAELINEQIIGPTHLTKDITRAEFDQGELKTSYVMHVKMKYILHIEFDLSVVIEPIFENGKRVGWLYHSEKTGGTSFIKVISDTILIHELENNWFSVELLSVNEAAKDKEDEARKHAETLFEYWESVSSERGSVNTAPVVPSESPAENECNGVENTETDISKETQIENGAENSEAVPK